MWSDRVLNPGPLAIESGALSTAIWEPAFEVLKHFILLPAKKKNGNDFAYNTSEALTRQ